MTAVHPPDARGAAIAAPGIVVPHEHAARFRRAYWSLRVGAAACFVGHGAFGIVAKAAWAPNFGVGVRAA